MHSEIPRGIRINVAPQSARNVPTWPLGDAPRAIVRELTEHDDVDRGRDRGYHERRIDVPSGEQGQRAELDEGIPRAVGVDGTHAGQP